MNDIIPPERADDDDESLALAMMDGDQAALRRVLELYGGKVRGWLKKHFGDALQPPELDEALNQAAFNVWRFADRFDPTKGSFGGWFLSIAQRAAQSILRQENKHLAKNLEYEASYDPAGDADDDESDLDKKQVQRLRQLDCIIEHKLVGNQRAIIKADLAAGGQADNERLAKLLGTSKNAIYVSRTKAHENIEKFMTEWDTQQERFRGKK